MIAVIRSLGELGTGGLGNLYKPGIPFVLSPPVPPFPGPPRAHDAREHPMITVALIVGGDCGLVLAAAVVALVGRMSTRRDK